MKKFITVFLTMIMVIGLVACGEEAKPGKPAAEQRGKGMGFTQDLFVLPLRRAEICAELESTALWGFLPRRRQNFWPFTH